ESEVLKIFAQQWERANREVMPTIPEAKPRVQIDYILLRSPDKDGAAAPSRWKVRSFQVLDEAVAYDERAMFAELGLLPAAKDDGQRRWRRDFSSLSSLPAADCWPIPRLPHARC